MHDNKLTISLSQEEHCYLLGFFWADCFFGRDKTKNAFEFSFEINSSDFLKIWPMLKQLGFSKFKERVRKNSSKSQSNVRIARKLDMVFFEKWNFHNKNEGCPLYFELSNEMKPFFIKGFLDGDGSISVDKNKLFRVGFNGNKLQSWDFLEHFCNAKEIPFVVYKKDRQASHQSHTKSHSYSVFEFTKLQDRIDFCKELPVIGLDRKLNEFFKFKEFRLIAQESNKAMSKLIF
jgi:hypothetical protein